MSAKDPERLLAEALRAQASGAVRHPEADVATMMQRAARPTMTTLQLILAAAITGLVIGIVAAVISLV